MKRSTTAARLTAILALLTFCLYLLFPLTGDDYAYMGSFRTIDGFDGPWPMSKLYRWYPFHWLHANGRFANLFAMLSLTFLPKWVIAAIMGAATWGMMALVLRLGGAWHGRPLAASAALAYIAIAFPWWDLMYSVDFNFNYPVATCAGLLFAYLWQRYDRIEKGWMKKGCLLAAFIAGGFHESMGAPLLAAGLWLVTANRLWPSASKPSLPKAPLAAFGAGVAMAFCSPGIWGRATAERVADAPLPELLLCSAPLTLAATALFCGLLLSKRQREWIMAESRGWWGFWMAASLGALLFCAVGGIIGRSGWFSQSFALIALLIWGKSRSLKLAKPEARSRYVTVLAMAPGIAAVFFTAAPIPFVAETAALEARARELLKESRAGVVTEDMPLESEKPWWTLKRVRCLDADDYYLHQVIADYYKKPRFVIVPPETKGMREEKLPEGAEAIDPGTFDAPLPERYLYTEKDGTEMVYVYAPVMDETPRGESESGEWLRVPRERDPGDR